MSDNDSHHELKDFPGRVYISTTKIYNGYGREFYSTAFEDVDKAVPIGEPVEVGIYQLVRTAKFHKTAVEVKTLKEVRPNDSDN